MKEWKLVETEEEKFRKCKVEKNGGMKRPELTEFECK